MSDSVDPDEIPHSVVSHLGLLHCLLRSACLNTYGKYGTCRQFFFFSSKKILIVFTISFKKKDVYSLEVPNWHF